MVFDKWMTETQSFRSVSTLRWVDSYTYFPLHLLVYHCKSSHDLINYARAHNSLWLHTEVSSMNHLSSLLAWVAVHKENRQSLEYPGASIHPDVY